MPAFAIQRDEATAAFLDGTKRGEFLLVKDTQTDEILPPQYDESTDPKRTGTIVSWSIVHQRDADGSVNRLPLGIVELDEGPWWWTSTPKRLAYQMLGERDSAETIPYFRLA